jgi:pimeloyl-ACP methyl ester carboxylesterase
LLPIIVAATLAIAVSFSVGVAVGRFQFWPFPILSKAYRIRGAALADATTEVDFKGLQPLSIAQLSRVSTLALVRERRNALSNYIWPSRGFPFGRIPDKVETGFVDSKFQTSPNLLRITKLTTRMRGLESVSYYFEPRTSRQCLMVYYHSHGQSFRLGKPTIDRLLKADCAVIALSMPLIPGEPVPVVSDSVFGRIPLRRHDQLAVLEASDFSPIALFVEPVVASLNYVLGKYRFDRIGMVGFSGGGWATTLYAALDERIRRSYPVAGTEPIWLTVRRPQRWSDYEQTDVGLYRIASYPELYVLGTSAGRGQLQILNRFDACCFYGRGYRLYDQAVSQASTKVGGSFRVFLDETHREHKLSETAMDTVLADFFRNH